jgi:hypothetical protein
MATAAMMIRARAEDEWRRLGALDNFAIIAKPGRDMRFEVTLDFSDVAVARQAEAIHLLYSGLDLDVLIAADHEHEHLEQEFRMYVRNSGPLSISPANVDSPIILAVEVSIITVGECRLSNSAAEFTTSVPPMLDTLGRTARHGT